MERPVSLALGIALASLATAGFMKRKKQLFNLMNVDTNHSIIRTPTSLLLLLGSRSKLKTTRAILTGVSTLYFAIGVTGLFDKRLKGILPSGLTRFDIIYHFLTGATTLWMGTRSGRIYEP